MTNSKIDAVVRGRALADLPAGTVDPVADDKVAFARAQLSGYMSDIDRLFKGQAKITLLIRTPGDNDADLMMTNDVIPEIDAMVKRARRSSST